MITLYWGESVWQNMPWIAYLTFYDGGIPAPRSAVGWEWGRP